MRGSCKLGCLVMLLVWAAPLHAQSGTTMTIALAEVEARSGPSGMFYPTSKLYRGDRVEVIKEEQGWLAIAPPGGSFSWIAAKNLDNLGNWRGVVNTADTPVRVGSRVYGQPPSVEKTKLPRGMQVTILGRQETIDGKPWYPILPTAQEVRYIPANAVNGTLPPAPAPVASAPPPTTTTARSDSYATQQAAGWSTQPQTTALASSAQPPTSSNPMWLEAERAEQSGNLVGAIRLYEDLAGRVKDTDPTLSLRCLNRSQYLRDRVRAAGVVGSQSNRPLDYQQQSPVVTAATPQTNMVLPTNTQAQNPTGFQLPANNSYAAPTNPVVTQQINPSPLPANLTGSQPDRTPPPGFSFPTVTTPAAAPAANTNSVLPPTTPPPDANTPQWSELGEVYRPQIQPQKGKRLYGLLSGGKVLTYAIADNGVDLEPYVGKQVRFYGTSVYHGELKNNLMTVKEVSQNTAGRR